MPAYSMARPSSATPTGATTRPIQKLPRTLTAVTRRYAPTAKSAPWAKFGMLRTPVISDRPSPIRAYSMPVAIPLRIWPSSRLKAGGSEASDVLAGGVFLRQRRVPGGDDVREIQLVLHRALRLAAQEEVRAQRLVRGAVHPHRPDDVVHLEAFERLHHGLHVIRFGLVEAGEEHARHRVGGRRRVTRRQLEPGLVALDEALRYRRVRRVVEVRADPEVVADLRRELHQLLHTRGPAHDERQLRRQPEVEDLARAGDGIAAEVDHDHHVGLVGRGLLHVVRELALAERVPVGADELDAVGLADFLDVFLNRPAEGVVGDEQMPALRLRVRLHEVVHDGFRRGVGAGRPLERVAVAAAAGDVLGAAGKEVHHFLALRHLRYRERNARGPRADDELRAFGVHRLFRAPGGGAGLRAAVARDVLDRPAEDFHVALFERHPHAAVVERADVGKGAGLVPQAEDHNFLRLGAKDCWKAQPGGRERSDLQDVSSLDMVHALPFVYELRIIPPWRPRKSRPSPTSPSRRR